MGDPKGQRRAAAREGQHRGPTQRGRPGQRPEACEARPDQTTGETARQGGQPNDRAHWRNGGPDRWLPWGRLERG